MQSAIRDVTLALDKFELGVALERAHGFMWDDFCDWYIELTKSALWSDDEGKKDGALAVLVSVLDSALRLLHPFVPFVTEKIYAEMPGAHGRIMLEPYPRYNSRRTYRKEAEAFRGVMSIIKALSALKTDTGGGHQIHLFRGGGGRKRRRKGGELRYRIRAHGRPCGRR